MAACVGNAAGLLESGNPKLAELRTVLADCFALAKPAEQLQKGCASILSRFWPAVTTRRLLYVAMRCYFRKRPGDYGHAYAQISRFLAGLWK